MENPSQYASSNAPLIIMYYLAITQNQRVAQFILPIAWLIVLIAPHTLKADEEARRFQEMIKRGTIERNLDPFLNLPAAWDMTPDSLESTFALPDGITMVRNPYYNWMSQSRERAVFMRKPFTDLTLNLSLFNGEIAVDEVTADFTKGKFESVRISIFNRGDSDDIGAEEFERRFRLCGQKLNAIFEVRPTMRKANYTQGLATEAYIWISPKGMAMLDYNPEAMTDGNREFLRLTLATRNATGLASAAFQSRQSSTRKSSLPTHVIKGDDGDVSIRNIPMVDQGSKGYCVVASVQRLFEYYEIPADQHQLAQIAGSDAAKGTSVIAIAEALGKIDYRFKTRFRILAMRHGDGLVTVNQRQMTVDKPFDQNNFMRAIRRSIDAGIPVLWSLELGLFPEIPAISPQTSGGHMRMIIGYNDGKNQVLFSDSWGAGHELKRMDTTHAYQATTGIFTIAPTVQ